jgi:hypothetical protein
MEKPIFKTSADCSSSMGCGAINSTFSKDEITTKKEGVITIYDKQKNLIAIVLKDEATRNNIFFTTEKMSFDEIELLLKK